MNHVNAEMAVNKTERHGCVVNAPASYLGGPSFRSWPGDWLS
jgi:hypothetical protein